MWRKAAVLTMIITASLSIGASRAFAVEFHSEVENTTLLWEATSVQTFQTNTGIISCNGFLASGSVLGTKGFATLTAGGTPSGYVGCTWLGFRNAENPASECEYVIAAAAETLTIQEPPGGNCATHPLNFSLPGLCKVTFGPQTKGSVEFENQGVGATRAILVTFLVEGLAYKSGGALCGVGAAENGIYTGTVIVRGREFGGAKQVGIWIE